MRLCLCGDQTKWSMEIFLSRMLPHSFSFLASSSTQFCHVRGKFLLDKHILFSFQLIYIFFFHFIRYYNNVIERNWECRSSRAYSQQLFWIFDCRGSIINEYVGDTGVLDGGVFSCKDNNDILLITLRTVLCCIIGRTLWLSCFSSRCIRYNI